MRLKIGGETWVGVKSIKTEMKVIRADGTVEDLGVVNYWHRNPLKRLMWRIRKFFLNRRMGRA